MKLNSKPGLILSLSYFGIFLLSTIFVLSIMASSTGDASLAGAPLIALTFPWSVIMAPIMRLLSESLFQGEYYLFFTILSLLPAALINATILYFIGKSFDDVAKNKKTPHGSGATPSRDRVNGLWK